MVEFEQLRQFVETIGVANKVSTSPSMDTLGERPLDLFEGVAEAFFVGLGDGRRTGVGAHAVFEEIDVLVVLVQFVFFEEVPHLGVGQGAHVLDAVLLYLSPEFVVHLFGDVCGFLSLELGSFPWFSNQTRTVS